MDKDNLELKAKIKAMEIQREIMTYYSRLAHAKREGEKTGKIKALKRNVLKMFQKVYPNEDTRFLEGLTLEQYDTLLDMIFDCEPLTTIKEYLNID